MPTQEILQKVKDYLQNSATFALLSESEQANYITQMESASDEQLVQVLELMENEDKKYAKAKEEELANASKLVEMAENLHTEIRKSKKIILKAEEEIEQSESDKLLESMEQNLDSNKKSDQNAANNKTGTKKKFLGIF